MTDPNLPILHTLCALATLCAAPSLLAQDDQPLAVGRPAEATLGDAEAHGYTVDCAAGQFVFGRVDQRGPDCVVTISGPDGARLGRFDESKAGAESFWFDTDAAGAHRVVVEGFEGATGGYVITLLTVEPIGRTGPDRTDQLMAPFSGAVPGGVVGVVQDGELVFARGYGMANLTHGIEFETGTASNIGSTSKQFTAFGLALLEQQGKLSLDDDVREHLPELPDFGQTVTLRHLLTHTSGYREFLNLLVMTGRRLDEGDYIDRDELVAIVQRQPELQNAPGAEWNYNNTGYALCTMVVEEVTGQPFDEWMRDHVFLPLGMTRTVVRAERSRIVPDSAEGYLPSDQGFRHATDLGGAMGPGAIYSTVDDLARWIANLGSHELGGEEVYAAMTTPFVLTSGKPTRYGLGLFLDHQRGLRRAQHGGADTAHRAMLLFFPELKAGVVTLSNHGSFPSMQIASGVAEAFFGEHMAPEQKPERAVVTGFDPAEFDPESFDRLAGSYEFAERPGFVLKFWREGADLFTQATGQPRIAITPTSATTFDLEGVEASVTFHRGEDADRATSITLHQGGDHEAERLDVAPFAPSAEQLEAYAGRYFSDELETFYTIEVQDDGLVLRSRRIEGVELTPDKQHEFRAEGQVRRVVFTVEDATVTGLLAGNGRTRDVRFVRVR